MLRWLILLVALTVKCNVSAVGNDHGQEKAESTGRDLGWLGGGISAGMQEGLTPCVV